MRNFGDVQRGLTMEDQVQDGWTRPWSYHPREVAQEPVEMAALTGGDAQSNAAMLRDLLGGERGPRREAVLLNAALGLVMADVAADLQEGYERARVAVDDGRALDAFERMRAAAPAA